MRPSARVDVVVLGAGAAGMMCAWEAGKRGRSVVVIDHARAPGEKIRISGGGRCNFTHLDATPRTYLSANPGFAISALKRYTPQDFVRLVDQHGIAWHEKARGQLFCDGSARQIVDMLTRGLADVGAELRLATTVTDIERSADGFMLATSTGALACRALVVATGGKSIPKMGATGFGYDLAERFGLPVLPTRPGLVPLTLDPALLERLAPLAGVAVEARVRHGKTRFEDGLLFTHRGLSGPAILQISSYWREGEEIEIALAPATDVFTRLREARAHQGRQAPASVLAGFLPKRLAQRIGEQEAGAKNLADLPDTRLRRIEAAVNGWRLKPTASEGYRTAEVTLGGVDTAGLDSRSMQARHVPNLYFIGEVVDVTGWLGGYNFQWAWSSGWVAGQSV
ncbi:NAD(P)/FAD-dependent oxidoreductase [Ancylobacter amanitiformis]|uniref:Rossmann fold flavoprotein n=1 Tax=Ancylobacter amanitiformis TaxID=217069 RepID=A0ABU0LKX1_9HYPH|nr:NAD(P)/FAD-dependent oxidoreductase [Ancylobacter amanitiformis]MDQ0509309.1 putative Rossmann fold flavoprotein [Ancylobacter amanitiformis]